MPIQSGKKGFPLSNLWASKREENAIVLHLVALLIRDASPMLIISRVT